MTTAKARTRLPTRTPAYVDRETGAAELMISPGTWDQWVAEGRLPPPAPGFPHGAPRWRWEDVDMRLAGKKSAGHDAYVAAADTFGHGS
jgi:hypothetical protein